MARVEASGVGSEGFLTVVGIDWAAQARGRAAAWMEAGGAGDSVTVQGVESIVSRDRAIEICNDARLTAVGVDVPFGWPREFSDWVADWSLTTATARPVPDSTSFRYRTTDRIVA